MTDTMLVVALIFVLLLAIETYILVGRVQLLLTYAEQLLAAAHQLLAAVPSKSAAPTVAPDDIKPHTWWGRLRALAVDIPFDEHDIDPPTTPYGQAIDIWQQTEIPPRTELPDDTDDWRARFTFAPTGRKPEPETEPETEPDTEPDTEPVPVTTNSEGDE